MKLQKCIVLYSFTDVISAIVACAAYERFIGPIKFKHELTYSAKLDKLLIIGPIKFKHELTYSAKLGKCVTGRS